MRNQRLQNTRDDPYHPQGCLSLLSGWSSRLWHRESGSPGGSGSLPNLARWSWGLRKFKGQWLQGRVAERTAPQRHRVTQKGLSSFWTTYISAAGEDSVQSQRVDSTQD